MSEYEGYDVKQLWQMVDAARQGLQPSHDQAVALDKAQQMLSGHAQALAAARDQLAAKWPPESNAASAAYLTELERLITAVRETALTCAVNVFHLTTVSDAILQTHEALTPLHDEYVANEQSLTKYNAEIDAFSTGAASLPGGKTIAKRAAKLFTSPQVDEGRQAELNQIAKQAMVALAGAAQDGATYIKPPALYTPPSVSTGIEDNVRELGGSNSGSPGRAISPPIINIPDRRNDEITDLSQESSDSGRATKPQATIGPTLSGFNPEPSAPAPSITVPPESLNRPGIPDGFGEHGVISDLANIGAPRVSKDALGARPGTVPSAERSIGRRVALGNKEPLRGGVIGDVPGKTGTADTGMSRLNPLGGVIGQQPPAVTAKGTSGAVGRRVEGSEVARQSVRKETRSSGPGHRRWDPNNPWEVDEGVDPVIVPDLSPVRIDPGPGIIGMDR